MSTCVRDVMTRTPITIDPEAPLETAVAVMREREIRHLPVVDETGRLIGMITDRDICMAVATRNKPASEVTVWETVSDKAYTCLVSDDVHTALGIMKREKVRRLPVVDENGIL